MGLQAALLLIVGLGLAGCTSSPSSTGGGYGQQIPAQDFPHVAFTADEGNGPGGTLTVASVDNGPVSYANVVLGGSSAPSCAWTSQANGQTMAPGDVLGCSASGAIMISDSGRNVLLYSGSFQ